VATLNGELSAVAALAYSAVKGPKAALPLSVLVEHIAVDSPYERSMSDSPCRNYVGAGE
jgi:hypothetical protein